MPLYHSTSIQNKVVEKKQRGVEVTKDDGSNFLPKKFM